MWWLAAVLAASPVRASESAQTLALLFDAKDPVLLREQALQAITAQLTDVRVQLSTHTLPTGTPFAQWLTFARPGTLGAFWVSLRDPSTMGLYFLAPGGERIVSRWVSTVEKSHAVGIEEIAVIIRSSVQSLLANKDFVREMAVAAVPVVQVEERSPWVRLSVSYEGGTFAPQARWMNGLKVAASVQLTPVFHLGLGYTAFPHVSVGEANLALGVARHPIEALAGFRIGKAFRVGADVGTQADVVTRSTQVTSIELTAEPPTTRVLVAFWARAVGGVRLGPWAQLYLSAGVEGVANRFNFVAQTSPSTTVVVLSPWGWRVVAGAGVSVALF